MHLYSKIDYSWYNRFGVTAGQMDIYIHTHYTITYIVQRHMIGVITVLAVQFAIKARRTKFQQETLGESETGESTGRLLKGYFIRRKQLRTEEARGR